eukprot:jgi/Orpsp1_1/1174667/evm.model.c7180000050909.1
MLKFKYINYILIYLIIAVVKAKNEIDNKSLLYKIKSKMLVYDAKRGDQNLEVIRMGSNNEGGYVIPLVALEASDVLMGYGINDDISFEREFSHRYNKTSYGFDCGVKNIETGDPNCHFFSECIGTSKYLYKSQTSSGKISTFSEQRQRFNLINKKYFIKMDIEGAEFSVMNDILKYSNDITGIAIEIHMNRAKSREKMLNLLTSLDENFVLIHLHGCNCYNPKPEYYKIPPLIQFTYVNKNLIDSYQISKNQKHPLPIDQPDIWNLPDVEFEINPNDTSKWIEPYMKNNNKRKNNKRKNNKKKSNKRK